MFGQGKQLSRDRFERIKGVKMFFYDSDSIKHEFGKYGLTEVSEIDESDSKRDKGTNTLS